MTRLEIDTALNRVAAEVMGWEFGFSPCKEYDYSTGYSYRPDEWKHPSGEIREDCPDYCSPDAPHSLLRGLLAYIRAVYSPTFLDALIELWPDIGGSTSTLVVDAVICSPRLIVAACLSALGKLPDGVTLDMVRETEVEG